MEQVICLNETWSKILAIFRGGKEKKLYSLQGKIKKAYTACFQLLM